MKKNKVVEGCYSYTISFLERVLAQIIEIIQRINKNKEISQGGFFCLFDLNASTTLPIICKLSGLMLINNFDKYYMLAQRNASSLIKKMIEHPASNTKDGAIFIDHYILSFYGLGKYADQALVLTLGCKLNLLSKIEAMRIARKSKNQLFIENVDSLLVS